MQQCGVQDPLYIGSRSTSRDTRESEFRGGAFEVRVHCKVHFSNLDITWLKGGRDWEGDREKEKRGKMEEGGRDPQGICNTPVD